MAHIEHFQIAGLAGRDDIIEQQLDRHVNIFFGLNGSGKTSLLKILHSALSNDTQVLASTAFNSAKVSIHSKDFKKTFVTILEKEHRGKPRGIRAQRAKRSRGAARPPIAQI